MGSSFDSIQRAFFIGLLIVAIGLFVYTVRDYLFPVFWAIVFAIMLFPSYSRVNQKIKKPSLSALIAIGAACVLVLVPLLGLGTAIGTQAFSLYEQASEKHLVEQTLTHPNVLAVANSFSLNPTELEAKATSLVQSSSQWLASEFLSFSTATFGVILKTIIMLYLLFFFLRDGEEIGKYIMRNIPLGDIKEKRLFARFAATTRATMKGTFVVALCQGGVGFLLFWAAGIDNSLLWGAVMAFLSVIPAIGPALVWLPAGVLLITSGFTMEGVVVLVGGAVVISSIDNILRPILVGRQTELPEALILLSLLGGIATFGIAGIVIGPVLAALALSTLDIFAEEYKDELSARG